MGKNTDDVSEMVRIVVSEQFRHPELIGLDSIYDLTTGADSIELVSDLVPNQNSKRKSDGLGTDHTNAMQGFYSDATNTIDLSQHDLLEINDDFPLTIDDINTSSTKKILGEKILFELDESSNCCDLVDQTMNKLKQSWYEPLYMSDIIIKNTKNGEVPSHATKLEEGVLKIDILNALNHKSDQLPVYFFCNKKWPVSLDPFNLKYNLDKKNLPQNQTWISLKKKYPRCSRRCWIHIIYKWI